MGWMRALMVAGALALGGCGYERMVSMVEHIEVSWAKVESQLQQRNDLVPTLVQMARNAATRERALFDEVADARARLLAGGSRLERIAAATDLTTSVERLLALAARHPKLQGDPQFTKLADELRGTEGRIAVERIRYNDAVRAYNAYVGRFPVVLWAGSLGFSPERAFDESAT